MFAPVATPPEVVRRINADLVQVLAMPDVKARLVESAPSRWRQSEAMRMFLREDRERWAGVVKQYNIKVEQSAMARPRPCPLHAAGPCVPGREPACARRARRRQQ